MMVPRHIPGVFVSASRERDLGFMGFKAVLERSMRSPVGLAQSAETLLCDSVCKLNPGRPKYTKKQIKKGSFPAI